MNDFIDLPHLPECLLGLPLETIHEIHSHTYHAIKADRQQRGEPVAYLRKDQLRQIQHRGPMHGEISTHARAGMVAVYTTPQPAAPKFGEEE